MHRALRLLGKAALCIFVAMGTIVAGLVLYDHLSIAKIQAEVGAIWSAVTSGDIGVALSALTSGPVLAFGIGAALVVAILVGYTRRR